MVKKLPGVGQKTLGRKLVCHGGGSGSLGMDLARSDAARNEVPAGVYENNVRGLRQPIGHFREKLMSRFYPDLFFRPGLHDGLRRSPSDTIIAAERIAIADNEDRDHHLLYHVSSKGNMIWIMLGTRRKHAYFSRW
jgi:hypothetical protein